MEILGVRIDNLSMEEVLRKVEGFLEDGQQHYLVTPNPEFLVRAQEDRQFQEILNRADLAIPDGAGLLFASRFLSQPIKERVTGTDLMEKICQQAAQKNWSVFLMGARPGIAEKAAINLRKKYSGLKVEAGFEEVIGQPDILFVALGAPKQEKWIVRNLNKRPGIKLAIGVGGAFDFIAGRVRRAPGFLQQLGLEWFWRLTLQPWRGRRVFRAVVKFPWLVVKQKLIHN
jgi:N-acetylglucosaminyldiphosphoundecaprenol N-acetyl-beta-D-mannosaminyltransferase